jgi:hypothetical protein
LSLRCDCGVAKIYSCAVTPHALSQRVTRDFRAFLSLLAKPLVGILDKIQSDTR